jgi:hypothetical protein
MCNQWIIYDAYQADKDNRPTGSSKHEKDAGADEEPAEDAGAPAEKPAGEKPKDHKKGDKDVK